MLKGKVSKYLMRILIFVVFSTSFTSWKRCLAGSKDVEKMQKEKAKWKC